MIVLTLSYPISANRYWKQFVLGKGPKARMMQAPSGEAKAYKESVAWEASRRGIKAPITGRVRIDVQLYPQRPQDWAKRARLAPLTWDDDVRCIDLDNANKVLLDALKGNAIEDDKWVRRLQAERMEPDEHGARVIVAIERLALPVVQGDLLAAA